MNNKNSIAIAFLLLLGGIIVQSCSPKNENIKYTEWEIQGSIFSARPNHKLDNIAVKDPSIVYFQDRYHLFYTAKSKIEGDSCKFLTACAYANASTIESLNHADRFSIDSLAGCSIIAPQIFYFEPQKLWYLIAQSPITEGDLSELRPVYLTNDNIENVSGWSEAKEIKTGKDKGGFWIDFWVICDDSYAYLFYSDQKGTIFRLRSPLNKFPEGFYNSEPEVALYENHLGEIKPWKAFEAAHIYYVIKKNIFFALLEGAYEHPIRKNDVDARTRFIFGMTADSLDGDWKRIENNNDEYLAEAKNLFFQNGEKSKYSLVSHPELIRSAYNQKMEIEDFKLNMLFQTFNSSGIPDSYNYNELAWELVLMKNY